MTSLKVGDKVRLTGSFWGDTYDRSTSVGDIVTVEHVEKDGTGRFHYDPEFGDGWFLETPAAEDEEWELVNE